MRTAIELITAEREEQIEKHGYTVSKDKAAYSGEELLQGALHAINPVLFSLPIDWGNWFTEKVISKTEIERFTIAAALIAAHIDKLIAMKKDKPLTEEELTEIAATSDCSFTDIKRLYDFVPDNLKVKEAFLSILTSLSVTGISIDWFIRHSAH
ncbi:hypothetical protein SAMN05428988_1334 [Chitinophaga sp. YR573]|uniref:hypothetical protein n=1 Tax=Chitinophaga sp. YR573 TaxID=1881040 RepID=UPI0008CFE0E4|nr:hypothetical protein [Chitinophaga sp. YR573]SEW02158.1 hypothetical protein SAMN05428988_1334 [Chitinophaga sp. YR573]